MLPWGFELSTSCSESRRSTTMLSKCDPVMSVHSHFSDHIPSEVRDPREWFGVSRMEFGVPHKESEIPARPVMSVHSHFSDHIPSEVGDPRERFGVPRMEIGVPHKESEIPARTFTSCALAKSKKAPNSNKIRGSSWRTNQPLHVVLTSYQPLHVLPEKKKYRSFEKRKKIIRRPWSGPKPQIWPLAKRKLPPS